MKILTSFTSFKTGEGERISYTYSEVTENGDIVSQNNISNFIVVDDELKKCIETINSKISERLVNA